MKEVWEMIVSKADSRVRNRQVEIEWRQDNCTDLETVGKQMTTRREKRQEEYMHLTFMTKKSVRQYNRKHVCLDEDMW